MLERTIIEVPAGTKYLSELVGRQLPNGLPNGVFNKAVCDCGATTLALTDEHKTIICSPRVRLLDNKHEQFPDTLVVKEGINTNVIEKYMQETDIPKILSTYDSLPKIARLVRNKQDWRVVIDEFHFLLRDSGFKSETEFRTLECLKEFPYVTYLSATPMLDKFLEQIEPFRNLPYIELSWENVRTVQVTRKKTPQPIDAALSIVRSYQNKAYPLMEIDGKAHESKECVIFLNSVTDIINIIKKSGLCPDEVNIIVGCNDENKKLIKKLGEGFDMGVIPLKGEKHKMVTFCTSTAYAGCDFYSECASTFVVCDSGRKNTAVDIATELKQIAGRQRLACNPFRDVVHFIYSVSPLDIPECEFRAQLAAKHGLTLKKIELFNNLEGMERDMQKKETLKRQKSVEFGSDYTMFNETTGCFALNDMAYLYEQYAYELQKTYANGIIVKSQLENNDFELYGNQEYIKKFDEQVETIIKRQPFADRMKEYCERKSNPFDLTSMITERNNPKIKQYYDLLGAERIKALGYKECALKNELLFRETEKTIRMLLSEVFYEGVSMETSQIKNVLNRIYEQVGVKKKGVAKDLEKYGYKMKPVKILKEDGSRKNGFRIS